MTLRAGGFSLVELAIVLVVLGTLTSAAVAPLQALDAGRRERQLRADLSAVRDALLAHLITQGRLPCPRADTVDVGTGCTLGDGGVPAAALALPGTLDASGALLDPWGRRYRYAVGGAHWTDEQPLGDIGIERLRGTLSVCAQAQSPCPRAALRGNDLAFVVVSSGADASGAGLQGLNARPGTTFTSAPPSIEASTRFDDGIVWASRSELVWWLIRASRLP